MERGSDVALEGSGSGLGAVSALAMLQALAPRSRTLGKLRLMSWRKCEFGSFGQWRIGRMNWTHKESLA